MTGSLTGKIREKGFKGELREDEPLHRHLSLRVGGPTALFAVPDNVQDVLALLGCLEEEGIPWVVMGGGTNLVFGNGGYRGCVLRLGGEFTRVQREDDLTLVAGAAVSLAALVNSSAEKGLSGMECLTGIPGTVGGAVLMNAGTSSGEIANVIDEVLLFDGRESRWVQGSEMGFSYRSSQLPEGHIILAAKFRLTPSTREEVRSRMKTVAARRKESQPAGIPSAGCWFRNPEGDSAGRLIDEAGMKGERCGGAQVSEVHANFLVNVGGATASDFLTLARKVKETVHRHYGVVLQEEVRIIDG